MIYLVGFAISTFVYTLLYLKVRSNWNWRFSLAISAGAVACIYLGMIYALQVDLYEGVIVLAIRRVLYGY